MKLNSNHINNYSPVQLPPSTGAPYTITTNTTTSIPYIAATNGISSFGEILTVDAQVPALQVQGRMVINGIDLEERLQTIERVLTIPERDVKLEKQHPNLKKLYDEYIHALAKYRTFEAIKGEENGTT
jgi:hypothetical protein